MPRARHTRAAASLWRKIVILCPTVIAQTTDVDGTFTLTVIDGTQTITATATATDVLVTDVTTTETFISTVRITGRFGGELANDANNDAVAACTRSTTSDLAVPFFPECSDRAALASACSCFGVTPRTITAPRSTRTVVETWTTGTVTTQITQLATETIYLTAATTTIVSTDAIALATITGPTTTVTCPGLSPLTCSTISRAHTTSEPFSRYSYDLTYATAGYQQKYNNPGNLWQEGFPPDVRTFAGDLSPCAAATACGSDSDPYTGASFGLRFVCSEYHWRCVQYAGFNTNISYYDEKNKNITLGMLWNAA